MTVSGPMATSNILAPSELIVLNGDQFATQSKFRIGFDAGTDANIPLLRGDAKVSVRQLGDAILAAALFGNQQAGALHFEVRQKKALFGLRKVDSLFFEVGSTSADWPASSIEARIRASAEQLSAAGRNEVYNILVDLIPRSSNPWSAAVALVMAGLGERGLLEATEVKKLKVITTTTWLLPETTLALYSQPAVDAVKQMLADAERGQPDIWRVLVAQIKSAMDFRTDRPDAGGANV